MNLFNILKRKVSQSPLKRAYTENSVLLKFEYKKSEDSPRFHKACLINQANAYSSVAFTSTVIDATTSECSSTSNSNVPT